LESPRRYGARGRLPNWDADAESQALMDRFELHLRRKTRLKDSTIKHHLSTLRSLVFASIAIGGPASLPDLLAEPAIIVKHLRELAYKQETLRHYATAVLRFIKVVVDDDVRKRELRQTITGGLFPKIPKVRRWDTVHRTTGGDKELDARRPVFWEADFCRIIDGAGVDAADLEQRCRDQLAVVLTCRSSAGIGQLRSIRWPQIEPKAPGGLWCAVIRGLPYRGRFLNIPIAEPARPFLLAMRRLAEQHGQLDYVFYNTRSKRGPVTYWTLRRPIRAAVARAGLPDCDGMTFRRAYLAGLKVQGLRDTEIRDAMGVMSLAAMDRTFTSHEWMLAYRQLQELHAIPDLTTATPPEAGQPKLPFLDQPDE